MLPCDADHPGKGDHIPVHPRHVPHGSAIILRFLDLISIVVFSFGLCASRLACMLARWLHGKSNFRQNKVSELENGTLREKKHLAGADTERNAIELLLAHARYPQRLVRLGRGVGPRGRHPAADTARPLHLRRRQQGGGGLSGRR
jgi:hypothetical protein